MGVLDDLANKLGFSSKSLGINTAADKAARETAARLEQEAALAKQQAPIYDESREMANIYNQQSQQPGMLSQAYESALKGLGGIGSKAGNILGSALGSAYAPGVANVLGGIIGYKQASKNRDAADAAMQQATNLASQMNYLQDPEVAKIQDDAMNKTYLQQALKGMSDRASMGLTPQDQAELEKIRNQQNQTFQAQQNAVQENMARRGMGNSGLALAQTMGASQAAGQQAAQNASDLSSQMFQAKQNALGNLANTAGSALNQQFNRDVTRGTAQDQVAQFNVNNQNARNRAMQQAQQQMATYQQQQGQNKAQAIGGIAQGVGQAMAAGQMKDPSVAFGQQKKNPNQQG